MERITNITNARNNLFDLVEEVIEKNEVYRITSKKGNVVLLSDEEYSGMIETLYLTSIPGMREKLIEGLNTPIEECVNGSKDWLLK